VRRREVVARRVAAAAARRFSDLGCDVEQEDPGWSDPGPAHKIVYEVNQAARQGERADQRPDWIEPTLMQMIENGRRVSAVEHQRAQLSRSSFYDAARRFFDRYDLLLTPQMPLGAWSKQPGPDEGPRQIDGRPTPAMFDRLPFTFPFNLTGQPAISVPCGFTADGLPVGLQIVGRWHADATVLRAAAAFEALQPWADRRPSLD
jgi:Asp-tRNA(Asn)/Glu-tRNA(Gln) amidotransferase A subunit family amidase